jgi:hypothetical protein
MGITALPLKTDTPLVINSYAQLTCAFAFQPKVRNYDSNSLRGSSDCRIMDCRVPIRISE